MPRLSKEVQAYLNAVPGSRTAHVRALHELITGLFPEATVDMSYKMPTYRIGEGWMALANQKRYVSLYTCSAAHIAPFKAKHPQYKTGKGCINFRERDALPLEDLKAVVEQAMRHPKEV
ncbi:MAG: iron chaperone [Gammaproteobacteria bacterium]